MPVPVFPVPVFPYSVKPIYFEFFGFLIKLAKLIEFKLICVLIENLIHFQFMPVPSFRWGRSADEVEQMLGAGWTKGTYGSNGKGWKFTGKNDGQSIFYSAGGSTHKGPYYGFSSGKYKKNKIVEDDYIPTSDDGANIIKRIK